MSVNPQMCIYRFPGWLKDHVYDGNDQTPYEPEIVSFGPYHRGNSRVTEMEKHKWRCLRTMLDRNNQHLDEYLREMKTYEGEVRACYQGPYEEMKEDSFVAMLVLDGCFMLEFLRVNKLGLNNLNYAINDPVFSKHTTMQVIARDMIKLENQLPLIVLEKLLSLQYKEPIKSKRHITKLVLRALTSLWITNKILTKQQLKTMRKEVATDPDNMKLHCLDIFRSSLLYKPRDPKVFVESGKVAEARVNVYPTQIQNEVNDITVLSQEEQADSEMGQRSIRRASLEKASFSLTSASTSGSWNSWYCSQDYSNSNEKEKQYKYSNTNFQPISWLYDAVIRVVNRIQRPIIFDEEMKANSTLMVYSVEELRDAGVKLKKRNSNVFWDVEFDKRHGLLEIPPIKIDDATKIVLLNLIAYEQCHLRWVREMSITDYVAFMDNLMDAVADVSHLYKAGIIVHQLGSDAEVAVLFSRLAKKAFVDWNEGRLSIVYKELNIYCNHKRHRFYPSWRSDYLMNPWAIICFLAATILLIVTILQTFYVILVYHKLLKLD